MPGNTESWGDGVRIKPEHRETSCLAADSNARGRAAQPLFPGRTGYTLEINREMLAHFVL
jgi:hypothetical protein